MKKENLDVYSEASNFAVIKAHGRSFPGSLIQGDSLYILCKESKKISELAISIGIQNEEFLDLLQEHQEKLLERLVHYQNVLLENGIELPYSSRVSMDEMVNLVNDQELE
jgi:hypothetical protein